MTRVAWTERSPRPGWDVSYTLLGGRWRTDDLFTHVDPAQASRVRRFTSQAFVACSERGSSASPDVAYWAAVCTKLLQRGTNPTVSPRAEELIGGAPAVGWSGMPIVAGDAILHAVSEDVSWTLDPSIALHPMWEKPFVEAVGRAWPDLLRWITPQAPLEALAGERGTTSRWVDFLLWHPLGAPLVIEIDGSGHDRQRGVDHDRDQLLDAARVEILRLTGREALDHEVVAAKLSQACPTSEAERDGPAHQELRRAMFGAASLNRFGFAVIEAVLRGFVKPRAAWAVDLDDPLGVVESAAGATLDLLAAVDDLWGTGIVPNEVQVGTTVWRRHASRFERADTVAPPTNADVRIVLDPDRPAHAVLPRAGRPSVVIRHAFLPGKFTWVPAQSIERRNLGSGAPDGQLRVFLSDLFGLTGFRDGQLPPIERALGGGDCTVMLPTGAGKSLIYQLASLLRPGIAVIVDPIVSLVDDQARRLRDEGIDRVSALHAASIKRATSREAVYEAVASGDSLFVFLTPERLQIQSFREYLGGAADEQLVNLAVVDEAHCVSEWGHDFRTSYLRLGRNLRYLCRSTDDVPPPILALTGTASPAVLRDVLRELDIDPSEEGALQRPATFDRPNLHFRVVGDLPSMQRSNLRHLLSEDLPSVLETEPTELFRAAERSTASGIVFVPHTNGKHGVVATRKLIRDSLSSIGIATEIEIYSGQCPRDFDDKTWDDRKRDAANRFKANDAPVLVSTKAFGMGIDKPNIRYTIHLGFPSSIEAFAQEAGRAGRDGERSECVLLAAEPDPQRAQQLLDLRLGREDRRAAYATESARRADDDLAHQLFFLYGSFPSVEEEQVTSAAVLDEIWRSAQPGSVVAIPRELRGAAAAASPATSAAQREKALYRLSTLGVVDDYTIDYGGNSLTVYLDYFDRESLDTALRQYAHRIEPGRLAVHEGAIESSPEDLADRVRHHLGIEIEMLYRVIEPARVRALDEMYRLTIGDPSGEDIRRRINAYLGDGPLAAILPSLIGGAERISVDEVIRALETVPPVDPFEWAGATARQLEDTPEHPIALVASGLAQAWLPNGDPERFQDLLSTALSGLPSYDVGTEDTSRLFLWVLEQLRTQMGGRRRTWCAVAWLAAPDELSGVESVRREEGRILAGADPSSPEVRVVLDRLLRQDSEAVSRFVLAQVGE